MIVIVSENTDGRSYRITPGDSFTLLIGAEKVLTEVINKSLEIDHFGAFVFCREDGTVCSPNMCGFFGQRANMPIELREAKRLHQLSEEQTLRFTATAPFEVKVNCLW